MLNADDIPSLETTLTRLGGLRVRAEESIGFDHLISEADLVGLLGSLTVRESPPQSLFLNLHAQAELKDNAARALVDFIKSPRCPTHLTISLANGNLSPYGMKILCAALENVDESHTLAFDLRGNDIRADTAKIIETASEKYGNRLQIQYADNEAILNIPPNAEFFVSLCKLKNKAHNFLILGAVLEDGKAYNLMNVGYGCWNPKEAMKCVPKYKKKKVIQGLYHEYYLDDETPVTYKAFTITREEYLNFVRQAEREVVNKRSFKAYIPREHGGNEFQYEFVSNRLEKLNDQPQPKTPINYKFSPANTCRQVAQKVASQYFQLKDWGRGVLRKFFFELPHPMVMEVYENVDGSFGCRSDRSPVIFPRPPKANEQNFARRKKIMRRLEALASDNSELAQKKFNAWKALYITLSPSQEQRTADQILNDIQNWLKQNKSFMEEHRRKRTHHFFTTKSEKLIKDIEEGFHIQPTVAV